MKPGIYEGSWKGLYWGKDGVIAQSRRRFAKLIAEGKREEAYSALSSTYYSAGGHAAARFRTSSVFAKPLWAMRAIWCLRRAGKLSDELKYELQNMTSDQLDIRGRILYRLKRYNEALKVTQLALGRENLTADTLVLLEMGRGEILNAMNGSQAVEAYHRALNYVDWVKPTTSVRLYRSLTAYYHQQGDLEKSRWYAEKALVIAKEHGLDDQTVKIKAIL